MPVMFTLSTLLSFMILFFTKTTTTTAADKTAKFPCKSNLEYDFVNIERFTDNMCAQCIWYMAGNVAPWNNFELVSQWKVLYNYSDTINVKLCNPECHEFKYETLKHPNNSIIQELKSPFYMNLLIDCCEEARECCSKMMSDNSHEQEMNYCPAKWDGFMCWNSSKPGKINYQSCPSMTYAAPGVKPTPCRSEIAQKECWPNGTWAKIPKRIFENNTWFTYLEEHTNYLPCSTPGATYKLKFIRVSIVFFVISLTLTIIGLILLIFIPMRESSLQLLCKIHKNFLSSLILTALFSLCVLFFIKLPHYQLDSMIDQNPIWCRALMITMKSARLTNYAWMMNEGIILWQMIVRPMPVNKINMFKFLLIGWVLPVIIMTIYTIVHSLDPYNTSCWTISMSFWELIYSAPVVVFIAINTILLLYLIYVILLKLRALNSLKSSFRKALVLVPVFGIHYFFYIVPFDPFEHCESFLFVLQYVMLIIEASQGAIVTTIFCFFNKEIRSGIRDKIDRWYRKRMVNKDYRKHTIHSINETELQQLNQTDSTTTSNRNSSLQSTTLTNNNDADDNVDDDI